MFHRILVPLDGSVASEAALPHSLAIADSYDCELCLVRVVQPGRAGGIRHDAVEWRLDRANAERYLERWVQLLSDKGRRVVVGHVAGWQLIAEMLHVPLGVLGFIAACAVAVALLRSHRPTGRDAADTTQNSHATRRAIRRETDADVPRNGNPARLGDETPTTTRPAWFTPFLATTILLMVFVYTPRPHTGLAQPPPAWEFPAELVTEPMPLKPDELDWLTRGGAESADRRRFEWRGITGSMILITSQTWRAQHRPERCFEVYGLSLDDTHTYLITPDFPLRFVSLSYGQGRGSLSATYWFQSIGRATDDYATRIWADLTPKRDQWVLVTILFDGVHDPSAADLQAFYLALHDGVAHSLEGGSK